MKGRDQRITGPHGAQQIPHTGFHLIRRFVRERDGENLFGTDASILDQMRDPIRDYMRFSTAGARENEYRPIRCLNRFKLLRI
jgi:hypothetical protein